MHRSNSRSPILPRLTVVALAVAAWAAPVQESAAQIRAVSDPSLRVRPAAPPVRTPQEATGFLARNSVVAVKAGTMMPGCVYVEDSDCFESDFSYSLGVAVDRRLGTNFFGGLYLDIHGLSGDAMEDTETLFDLGVAMKAQLGAGAGSMAFRPGIGLGYGRVTVMDETAQFLTLRGMLEVLLPRDRYALLGEAGVYLAPTGGTEDLDARFGPGVIVRIGVAF